MTVDDLEKLKAELLLAFAPAPGTAPMDSEAEAAKNDAVADLAADVTPDAMEAVHDFTSGDVQDGFDILEKQARSAEVQAAEKWRRLGALANGVDTTRARRAYEEAFRLQPDNFFTAVMLARLRMQAGDLNAAAEAAAAVVRVATTDREKSVADNEYGDVLVAAGDLTGARSRFEDGLKVAERLAEHNPGSAEAQRDVSVSLNKLGNVLVVAGDLVGARLHYEESLIIRERLAENNSGSAQAQRDVSVSLSKLGDVLVVAGDLEGARPRFEEVLKVVARLAENNQGSAQAQRDVSVSLNKLGDVLVKAGDLEGARSRFEEDLKIAERLAENNPGSAEAQRDVSISLNKLGDVLVAAGDFKGARSSYEESLKIIESLAENNPGSAEVQRDLMASYAKLGGVSPGQGWFAKALTICEKLVSEGRLAPADGWMLDDLRKRAAADD
ncbi:MAG: tetratricopeptide repeat protein [Rhodospirillales bacterium]|nr:tetratricopeptide repeat protein [Rhodospirillales bacterium]